MSIGSSESEKVSVQRISISSDEKGAPTKAAAAVNTPASAPAGDGDLTRTDYPTSQESGLVQIAAQETTEVELKSSPAAAKSATSPLAPLKLLSTSSPLPSSSVSVLL